MANNFSVLLKAIFDESSVDKELREIQNRLNKNELTMKPKLDESSIQNKLKDISDGLAKVFSQKYSIDINSKDIVSAFNHATKEANNLADAIGKVHEKSIDRTIVQSKKDELAQSRAINKELENQYKNEQSILAQKEKQLELNRKNALEYTKSATKQLNDAIAKYSKGDSGSASQLAKSLNSGVSNFGDLSNVNAQIEKYKTNVSQVIQALKDSHSQVVAIEQAEKELQSQKEAFARQNQNAIDYEIQKREEQASRFSSQLKQQMQEAVNAENRKQQEIIETQNLQFSKQNLSNNIEVYLRNNTKLSKTMRDEIVKLQRSIASVDDDPAIKNLEQQFKTATLQARALGQEGKNFSSKLAGDFKNFWMFLGAGTTTMQTVNALRDAVSELKEVDTILTEISKTSDATTQELKVLGNEAFEAASKYGRVASDYLTSVQEMNRSGFYGELGKEMAELSIMAQSAGDMTAELSQEYLLATNAAYKYNASISDLTSVLDGQNNITNKNSVAMEDMAEATKTVGSIASQTGVEVNELSSVIGTIVANTKKDGSEVGTGLKSIFINLQNISSSKINKTLAAAGTSMTTLKNGIEEMRSPIDILKDLAVTYNSIGEKDPLRSMITTNLGGKYYAEICVCV